MSRNTYAESPSIVARGQFTTGDTVTISLYRNASSTPESLVGSGCTEIGTTGVFLWSFSDLTTAPTTYSDYLWIMDNGATTVIGNQQFGGYVETIDSNDGANLVTLNIQEADTTPIPDVEVQLWNSGQTLLLDTKTSDVNGQVFFTADDGTYKVVSNKTQVSFTLPETLTVSGVTTDTYNGALNTITPASGAGECEVSIFASSQKPSSNLSTLAGSAQIKTLPTLLTGIYYSGLKVTGTYDATTGRLSWILPRGAVVYFKVDVLGINAEKTVPTQAAADYQDL